MAQTWISWAPLTSMGRVVGGGCTACIDQQLAVVFIDLTVRSAAHAQSLKISMLSNLRSAWRTIACAHIIDCTEDEEQRFARGHVTLDGDECELHTHGMFLPDHSYTVHAQVLFRAG